jgi:hypothetical protein
MGLELIKLRVWDINLGWGEVCPSLLGCFHSFFKYLFFVSLSDIFFPLLMALFYKWRRRSIGESNFYKSLVECLCYLTCTRLDILFGAGLVSRFIEIPRFSRLQAAKRILRFVKGISTYGLFYPSSQNLELVGYSDNCRTLEKPRAASPSWRWRVFLSVIGIEFVGSRHLVFNWGLLGNPSWLVLSEIRG